MTPFRSGARAHEHQKLQTVDDAIADLKLLKKAERRTIINELETKLINEPTVETRDRKKLRPHQLAEWELRLGNFRIFYDVDQDNELIRIQAVGYKVSSRLIIQGREYKL